MELHLQTGKYKNIPFPYFLTDRKLRIISASKTTLTEFPKVNNFLDVVGAGSKKKAVKFILQTPSISKIELNLRSMNVPSAIYDVYVQYEGKNYIHIFCVNKNSGIFAVQEALNKIEAELHEDNENLREKNAQLEDKLREDTESQTLAIHELQDSLNRVKNLIEKVNQDLTDPEKKNDVKAALDEIDHLNDLIFRGFDVIKT
ncbi:hypothetical protein [Metabacillus arenae]|uniref:Uncharacterized protein n=1 Tax=Metabacillus arenae TaxID=2771434 RepID=A0A926NH09_9BACI|nr:hypothetical protein [Metabacillus arenae]MBD1381131.1 hypothetical protein [Metabacillus arenae]